MSDYTIFADEVDREEVRQAIDTQISAAPTEIRSMFRSLDATSIDEDSYTIVTEEEPISPEPVEEGEEFEFREASYKRHTVEFEEFRPDMDLADDGTPIDPIDANCLLLEKTLNQAAYEVLRENSTDIEVDGDTISHANILESLAEVTSDEYLPDVFVKVSGDVEVDGVNSDSHNELSDLAGRMVVFFDQPEIDEGEVEAFAVDTQYFGYEVLREGVRMEEYEDEETGRTALRPVIRLSFFPMNPEASARLTNQKT